MPAGREGGAGVVWAAAGRAHASTSVTIAARPDVPDLPALLNGIDVTLVKPLPQMGPERRMPALHGLFTT
jgi:hypothetical protein